MRILGIDPGLRLTGYGVIDVGAGPERLVDAGVIRLDGSSPVPERLVELEKELESLLDEHRPDVCAVEKLYAHYAHPTTAITMGHGRGVVLLAMARRGIRICEISANRIKQAITGHGHAHKDQMQRAIQAIFRLKVLPTPPDVADALAIAVCCSREIIAERTDLPRLSPPAATVTSPRTAAPPASARRVAKRAGVGETPAKPA